MRALNPRLRAARWFGAVALFTASCHHSSPPAAPAATLSSVAVSGTAPAVGATAQFSATATFSDGTTQSVTAQATWASSDTTVASVSSSGLVSGVAPGGADISATYQNVTGRARVTIVRPVVPTYTISGALTDGTSGGILPNVDIQATDSAGKTLSTKTGSAGTYTIGGLAAGTGQPDGVGGELSGDHADRRAHGGRTRRYRAATRDVHIHRQPDELRVQRYRRRGNSDDCLAGKGLYPGQQRATTRS